MIMVIEKVKEKNNVGEIMRQEVDLGDGEMIKKRRKRKKEKGVMEKEE